MTDTVGSAQTKKFEEYSDKLEEISADEDLLVKEIADRLYANNARALKKYRHGIRDAHAKGHGVLIGTLTIEPNLREEYAQGLFAEPRPYDLVARLSSTSGALRSDQTRGIRGLGIKVLGVTGKRALPDDKGDDGARPDEQVGNQDFILVTHCEFPFSDAREYLKRGMFFAWLLARLPDVALILAGMLFGVIKPVLGLFDKKLPMTLELFAEPHTRILGKTFDSSAPLRWGKYVAKVRYEPLSDEVRVLAKERVPWKAGKEAFRDEVVEFFKTQSATYALLVQLCTDKDRMPIEDAKRKWPEKESPYVRVGTIHFPKQGTDSPERRKFGDDIVSFNSWHGLDAHRPLGSINRLKKLVYEASSDFRHRANQVPRMEPRTVEDLPG